jgi:competence protein ComEC
LAAVFLAVLSLVLFNEPVGKFISHWPALGGVTEILKTTLAVQILTCPWMVYKFSQLSLVAPLANVLLLPTLPLILVLGIIFLILSALWPPAAILVGWVVWYLLHQMISLVETLSAWPLAAIEINGLDFCWVIIIYFFIFLLKTKPRSFLRKTG